MIARSPQNTHADQEFTQNLRYLCSYYTSMSDVCRRVGFNRQQFNKYVSGIARPSNRNMRRLCEFFGVEEFEILSPHRELRKIVEIRGVKTTGDGDSYLTRILKRGIEQSDPAIRKYCGYYFTYYYSFSVPGKILKAVLYLSERDGFTGYKRIERLVDREQPSGASFVFKYEGLALYLRERIFLIDREVLTGNELSHSIVYPSYKNKVSLLTGLTLGTAGQTSREPICSRILLEYLGPTTNIKEILGQCGLYRPDSHELDPAVVGAIENVIPPGSSALRALPS